MSWTAITMLAIWVVIAVLKARMHHQRDWESEYHSRGGIITAVAWFLWPIPFTVALVRELWCMSCDAWKDRWNY